MAIIGFAIVFTGSASASEYLGLDIGSGTKEGVITNLKSSGAIFEVDYGYQGYANDLPMIKVASYNKFNKYGKIKESWLSFSPENKLYNISVTWSDSGKTFKIFKDALDSKYGYGKEGGRGFKKNYTYQDVDTTILLIRNSFGFGDKQTTSLAYVFNPALQKVNDMKKKIDKDIRMKNAAKAGSDL